MFPKPILTAKRYAFAPTGTEINVLLVNDRKYNYLAYLVQNTWKLAATQIPTPLLLTRSWMASAYGGEIFQTGHRSAILI